MTTSELNPEPINVKSKISGTLSLKTDFSGHHMLSAAHFARQSAIIEKNYKDEITEELRAEHRAYVTGAIIVSVASLEATINEVFIRAIDDDDDDLFKDFDPTIPKVLAEFWTWDIVKRSPVIEKYRCVLSVANKEAFDCGSSPYQEMDNLIKLRNALVHYKPEWDTDLKNHKRIENRLKSRFNINPFSHDNNAFFPKKCLGHGCAEWSVKSTIEFIEDFYRRMGFPPKWNEKRSARLKTK
ncbi:MAG: hypothetical protein EF813_06160 [Methanosarcinales archaeon]|nr:MAG: hypothetical protein EF813_06160 [Methanosarcinales archaeon]